MKFYIKDFKKRIATYLVAIIILFASGIACVTYGSIKTVEYKKLVSPGYRNAYAEFVNYKKNDKSNNFSMEYVFTDSEGVLKEGVWERPVVKEEYAKNLIGKEIMVFYNPETNIQVCDFDFNPVPYGVSLGVGCIMLVAMFVCCCRVFINFKNKKQNKEALQSKDTTQVADSEVVAENVPQEKWRKLLEKKSTIVFHILSNIVFVVWLACLIAYAHSAVTICNKNMSADLKPVYATFVDYELQSVSSSRFNYLIRTVIWYDMIYELELPSGKKIRRYSNNIPLQDEQSAKNLLGDKKLVFVDMETQLITENLDFSINAVYLPAILSVIPIGFILNSFFWVYAYSYAIIKDKKEKKQKR